MNKARAADLLKKEEVHPVSINMIMSEYFPDWIMWEPETIESGIRSITAQGFVNTVVLHKVGALQTLHNNESPWKDWETFNWVNQPFNDEIANFQYAKRPDIDDLYITVATMNHIRKKDFEEEVINYIAAACLDSGILFVPPPLDFAQGTLDMVEYRCTVCGNIDEDETNKMCDRCHSPESALIKYPKYFDWREVKNRWEKVQDKPLSELATTGSVVDVHIGKLAGAVMALADREKQLAEEKRYVLS